MLTVTDVMANLPPVWARTQGLAGTRCSTMDELAAATAEVDKLLVF